MNQELIEQLKSGIVNIVFTKTDGTQRKMRATLAESYILPEPEPKHTPARKKNSATQSVWDVDVKAWRSFRWDRLIMDHDDL
jgi:hypothetical protein